MKNDNSKLSSNVFLSTPDIYYAGVKKYLKSYSVTLSNYYISRVFTHKSFSYENNIKYNNERLEFLGDSILGQVITVKLYNDFPNLSEGVLAKKKSSLVNSATLASIAKRMSLGEHILLGKGEILTNGINKESILADCLEALIGAVYLEQGHLKSENFIIYIYGTVYEDIIKNYYFSDPKTSLQEYASKRNMKPPRYEIEGSGPDHSPLFVANVYSGDDFISSGEGKSKKYAEIAAAKNALLKFKII